MPFIAEFRVGDPGAPADGAQSYYNPLLAGASFKIWREGQFQYLVGDNRLFSTGSGTVFFIPALSTGERIKVFI